MYYCTIGRPMSILFVCCFICYNFWYNLYYFCTLIVIMSIMNKFDFRIKTCLMGRLNILPIKKFRDQILILIN